MKILHVASSYKPAWETGGVNRVAYEMTKGLAERGHEVTVFTTDRGQRRVNVRKNHPVVVDGMRVYYFANISNYLAMKQKVVTPYYLPIAARDEVRGLDLIHIHEHRTMLAAAIHHYARKYAVPYILQAHGSLPASMRKQKLKRLYDNLWGYRLLQDACKLIAVTKTEAEQYKSIGLGEDRIEVVPNGIDPSEFDDLPQRGAFRSKWGVDGNHKIILYLGRMEQSKGLDLLGKAFARALPHLGDSTLVIAGPDHGYLPALKGLIKELKIEEKVLLTGPLYERAKLEAYVDADVHVSPRAWEPFGLTLIEACACGTPVICCAGCGIADVIDGNAGLVVPYDQEELTQSLLRMLSNGKMRERFGENGKLLVREQFAWPRIVAQVESIYRSCISTRHLD